MFVGRLLSSVANEGCNQGDQPSVNRPYACLFIGLEVVQRTCSRQSFPTVLCCLYCIDISKIIEILRSTVIPSFLLQSYVQLRL